MADSRNPRSPEDSRKGAPPRGSSPQDPHPHPFDSHTWMWLLFGFAIYYLLISVNQPQPEQLPYSDFKQAVTDGRIDAVTLRGEKVSGGLLVPEGEGQQQFVTYVPVMGDEELLPLLERNNVTLTTKPDEQPLWVSLLVGALPWLLLLAFIVYSSRMLQRRMGGGGGDGLFGFSKSRAKQYQKTTGEVHFDDVAGIEHAKDDLKEIVQYLTRPEDFRALGAAMPKGVLLMGPPGTGKTLIARALAAEAGVAFFSISGSEFIEMFVGVGASRVRDMFLEARKQAPALIFIDEIDSVGRVRGTGLGGGNDEREQTLNQILAEMDGFNPEEAVVVIAATNRPDVLDPALMRPGRFDRKIVLELPQKAARLQILQIHTRKMPLSDDVDLAEMAAVTVGFSGADLHNLANEAALHAAREKKATIDKQDFDYAHDKVIMGAERKELLNPNERKRIAYHESGHAILAHLDPEADPVRQVTIIPRGRALGMTEQMPEEDRHNYSEGYLRGRLAILLGGRSAEKLVFDEVSTGAADDLKNATDMARRMIAQWGMSETLGPVHYHIGDEHPFLGYELTQEKDFSEATAQQIDDEVRTLVRAAEQQALETLRSHRAQLDRLANALLEQETLDRQQIIHLLEQPA